MRDRLLPNGLWHLLLYAVAPDGIIGCHTKVMGVSATWGRAGSPKATFRKAHISGQSSCPLSPNSKTNQLLRAACRDWTGYVKINRPNCLIPKPLTLTFHAGRIWPVYLLLFVRIPLTNEDRNQLNAGDGLYKSFFLACRIAGWSESFYLLVFAILAPAQTKNPFYSISTYHCTTQTECTPVQLHKDALSARSDDRVALETGAPFILQAAANPTYYAKSEVSIASEVVTLSNLVQLANHARWTYVINQKPMPKPPGHALARLVDHLTVTGAAGAAYLLPIYQIDGTFVSDGERFLESSLSICPGTSGGCAPQFWYSKSGSSDLHLAYQSQPRQTLAFEFGKQFTFNVAFSSTMLPKSASEAKTTAGTFRQEERADFTIRLIGVSIADAEGKQINGALVTAESGVLYKVLAPLAADVK